MAAKFGTGWNANSLANMTTGGYFDGLVTPAAALSINATGGPFGGPCLAASGGGSGYVIKNFGANLTTIFWGQWWQLLATPVNCVPVAFLDSATPQVYLQISAGGQIGIYSGVPGSGTLLATSVGATLSLSRWIFVELGVVFGTGTSGSVELKFNGADVISLTASLNTAPSGNARASVMQLGLVQTSGSAFLQCSINEADLYVCDATGARNNTFLGPGQMATFVPTSNGATDQFTGTPNTGANTFLNVNANPSNPANYNFSNTATNKDLFAHAAMSASVNSILFMQLGAYWGLDAAGARTAQLVMKSGATEADLPASPLSVSPGLSWGLAIEEVDPNTAAAMTVTAFNSMQFGYLLVS